jgi:voltage-gated potassium channel
MPSTRRQGATSRGGPPAPSNAWWVGAASLAAILVVYFAVPVRTDQPAARLVGGVALTLVGVAGVAAVVIQEARRERAGRDRGLRGLHLILALELVLVGFAFAYYLLAVNAAGQFLGIGTRLDALYFSAVTTTTVGYGDVAPVGQAARAVVTTHLIFNVAFVAIVGGLIRRRMGLAGASEVR